MNKYLISLIEIIVLGAIAKFSAKNIDIFTGDDTIVRLNYIFWGIIIVLSVLINFKLYIYFGSVFVLGIIFLAIYIHKIVKVITFVEKDYNLFFWMIFGTLFLPILILLITKGVLYKAINYEAPQGYTGEVGKVGNTGTQFFIESVGDRAYVLIVNGVEEYIREIFDRNEIDYDGTEMQFNNMYLKDNLKRICNSEEFITKLWNLAKTDRNNYQSCAYYNGEQRYCTENNQIGDNYSIPSIPSLTKQCVSDKDCNVSDAQNIINENQEYVNLLKLEPLTDTYSDDENIVYNLFLRVKYWIRLILENNCEQDKKLRKNLKIQDIYKLSDIKMGFVDSFREFQEDPNKNEYQKEEYLLFNSVNHLRMNNLLGRKFLQSNFQNHKYWQSNNVKTINRNPFDIIHQDPFWNYGTGVGDECKQTDPSLKSYGKCDIREHAKTPY